MTTLSEIEARLKAATPGRWFAIKGGLAESDEFRCAVVVDQGDPQRPWLLATIENGAPGDFCETEEANANLIANAPSDIAFLLPLARRAMEMEKVLEDCLSWMRHARVFISTREKMHADGRSGFDDAIRKGMEAIESALPSPPTSTEEKGP